MVLPLDGAVLAGRSGTSVRALPGQCTQRRRRQIARPIAIAVHNAINIHSTGIFLPENSGRSARPDFSSINDVAKRTLELAAREETAKARFFHKI